ncbi:MAG: hypothetical protein FJX29_06380 [Alphaproteobacteria bacterium]|nr:hypothetical protein [Alphaproteobacteria bacterium]
MANTNKSTSGSREPLLCLAGDAFANSELAQLLGQRYHLVSLPAGADAQAAAQAAGASSFRILASGKQCARALALAATQSEAPAPVVLLSPDAGSVAAAASFDPTSVKAQVLALFGARGQDGPPAAAGIIKRTLPAVHLIYVFDAVDMERERPQAVAEAVLDFLARGEGFLVNNLDGRIFA